MTDSPTPQIPKLREADSAIRTLHVAMHVLFVVLLIVGFARALANGADVPLTCLALLAFVGLYLSGLRLEKRAVVSTDHSRGAGTAWIVALIAAWAGLLALAPDFVWLAFALYFLALHVARRPVSFALIALILAISIAAMVITGDTRPGMFIGPVMGMLVALGISWVYNQLRAENEARKQLVEQLLASQEDLLAAQEALAQTQREAGVLGERTRLARDIHDTLAQSFSSILLLARAGLGQTSTCQTTTSPAGASAPGTLAAPANAPQTTTSNPAADASRTRDVLQQIEAQAQSGLTDARSVVGALTPTELTGSPLSSALTRLTDRLHEQTGLQASTHTDGTPYALATTQEVALLRIAQSALANVRQHARATRCAVNLSYEPGLVRLEIVDDGRGFTLADIESAPLRGSGFGIRGMRSRIAELGGSFDTESTPGDGGAIIVTIPTAASQESA